MRQTLPACVIAFLSVTYLLASPAQAQNARMAPMVPLAKEGPMYSGTINKVADQCGLLPLQQTTLPADALEIRIWEGFGEGRLRSYVLRRTKGVWSAIALALQVGIDKNRQYQHPLPTPKAGWPAFWSDSQALGLLTLPDSSTLPDEKRIYDGTSYVVEIRDGSRYRTYHYDNPRYQAWPQAKQMVKIAALLHSQFSTSP